MKPRYLLLTLLLSFPLSASTFTSAPYTVCFTPGGACTQDIISAIRQARETVLVQSYSFTSLPIEQALISAHRRGVNVQIIFDKSQLKQRSSLAKSIVEAGIPAWVDYRVAIAHNKVMIVDGQTVITGSFNFTKAAQMRNAENLLIIRDIKLAMIYSDNWQQRQSKSRALSAGQP